jgi:hypothetical protein
LNFLAKWLTKRSKGSGKNIKMLRFAQAKQSPTCKKRNFELRKNALAILFVLQKCRSVNCTFVEVCLYCAEPDFVNVPGAQELIPSN